MGQLSKYLTVHHNSLVFWTTVAALVLRLVISAICGDFFVGNDTEGYTDAVHALLAGQPIDSFARTLAHPLYVAFTAGLLWVFAYDYRWVVFIQHILGVVAAVCFYGAFRLLFPKAVSGSYFLLIALLFDKHLLFGEHLIQTEGLFVFIGSTVVLLLALWTRAPSFRISLLIGLQLSLFALCRQVGVVFVPIVLAAMTVYVLRRDVNDMRRWVQLMSAVAPLLLILGGWTFWNYVSGEYGRAHFAKTLFGVTAEFIDYDSPSRAVLKMRLRPILNEGYRVFEAQLAAGKKRFEARYKERNIYNWVYEVDPVPWKIVEAYAREDLLETGIPVSAINERELLIHAGKIGKDLAIEAIRNNTWKWLTKWVGPEFLTLFFFHSEAPYSFTSRGWMMERFYSNLVPGAYAEKNPLPPVYRKLLERKRSDLTEVVRLYTGVKANLIQLGQLFQDRGLDVNGAIALAAASPIWTAKRAHRVLFAVDGVFRYSPFPWTVVLSYMYFGVLAFLVFGWFQHGEWTGAASPEVLWTIMLFPLAYGLIVAAFNDAIVRYVVPMEPFLWFAAIYAVMQMQALWERTQGRTA